MILQAPHSHLYPGLGGTVSGLERISGLRSGCDCLVEFADGSAATARVSTAGGDWRLDATAYRTAAGTDIAAKRWRIRFEEDGVEVVFRVVGKV